MPSRPTHRADRFVDGDASAAPTAADAPTARARRSFMFEQIELENLSSVKSLFDDSHRLRMVISSILAGNSPARLWAAGGGLFLLWDRGNNVFYAAADDPPRGWGDALGDLLRDRIIPMFAETGDEYFSVDLPDSPDVEKQLRETFSPFTRWEREKLFLTHPGPQEVAGLPSRVDGVTFVPIDRGILCGEGPDNWEVVRGEILYMWPSVKRFLAHGWGTAAVLDGSIIGWCTAEYVGRDGVGIGIEIEPNMRRRGVAVDVGTVFLAECSRRRRMPHWECDAANEPSVRLADRLGFELMEKRRAVAGLLPGPAED